MEGDEGNFRGLQQGKKKRGVKITGQDGKTRPCILPQRHRGLLSPILLSAVEFSSVQILCTSEDQHLESGIGGWEA